MFRFVTPLITGTVGTYIGCRYHGTFSQYWAGLNKFKESKVLRDDMSAEEILEYLFCSFQIFPLKNKSTKKENI